MDAQQRLDELVEKAASILMEFNEHVAFLQGTTGVEFDDLKIEARTMHQLMNRLADAVANAERQISSTPPPPPNDPDNLYDLSRGGEKCYNCGITLSKADPKVGWNDADGEGVYVCATCVQRICEEIYDEVCGVQLTAENVRRRHERLGISDARKDE